MRSLLLILAVAGCAVETAPPPTETPTYKYVIQLRDTPPDGVEMDTVTHMCFAASPQDHTDPGDAAAWAYAESLLVDCQPGDTCGVGAGPDYVICQGDTP